MCTRYEICSCDQALFLRDALERAWIECPIGATKTQAILREALDTDHASTLEYYNDLYRTPERE